MSATSIAAIMKRLDALERAIATKPVEDHTIAKADVIRQLEGMATRLRAQPGWAARSSRRARPSRFPATPRATPASTSSRCWRGRGRSEARRSRGPCAGAFPVAALVILIAAARLGRLAA
jgi:hypothetical protein